jgi:alkyl hydroperoxide reductase subunit D
MTLTELIDSLPAYAKDLKLNFSSIVRQQTELTPTQLWGTFAACAIASRNADFTQAAIAEATSNTSALTVEAAKAAAAIMGMNNIYYRFQHLTANEKYKSMRAGLRMNVIRTHGADPLDFELWCAAVSAINGCGACVDAHEKTLREKGIGEEKILAAIRIASVIHAIAGVLDSENASPTASAASA